jgi:hypothetical protein
VYSTFNEIREEVAARGFDHVGQQRLGQMVNQAALDLLFEEDWPFRQREYSIDGNDGEVWPPERTVIQVQNGSGDVLRPTSFSDLEDSERELDEDGRAPTRRRSRWRRDRG